TPCYGLAEATCVVTSTPLGRGPTLGPRGVASSGVPIPGCEVRVSGGDPGSAAGAGGRGQSADEGAIAVRSPSLLDVYVTSAGLVDPRRDGWLQTTDEGLLWDGDVFVFGRRDEVVIVRGENVFAEDVEAIGSEVSGAG